MVQDDLGIVYEISKQANLNGISTNISERDSHYGEPLSEKIERSIKASDCMLIFLTKDGTQSAWVNQEIGFAKALGKLRIPIIEEGVQVKGYDIGNEYIRFNREDPYQAMNNTIQYLKDIKLQKEQNEAIGWLILGGLALLGLISAAAALNGPPDVR
jgi:hypothetical protein